MEPSFLKYVHEMVVQQIKHVEDASEEDAGEIAFGLTNNDDFLNTVYELFSPDF